jgi:O-antigen ligase
MGERVRHGVAPAYLLLCLLLGGSAQGVWTNMLLQLLGIAILAWAAIAPAAEPLAKSHRQLLGLVVLSLVVVALQLVPLPPDIWDRLGGRGPVSEGYRVLGIAAPWLSISLTPHQSLAALLSVIPAVALLAAVLRLGGRPLWLALALIAGTIAGVILGALQVSSAVPEQSPWYLYSRTNFGAATGFFANANHMAILLVSTLPFLAAMLASARGEKVNVQRFSAALAVTAGLALIVAVGIILNGSLAGFGLLLPVLIASGALLVRRRSPAVRGLAIGGTGLLFAAAAVLVFSPLAGKNLQADAATSIQSRAEMREVTAQAAADFMPLGSGLGSFRRVYALYEDHERLDPRSVVNHAHNDYLELALELGLPGILLLALFLAWWGRAAWRAWTEADADAYARAATIASAAILAHSLVDYPLRTAAISGCFAMCLAVMAMRPRPASADGSSLWPTRHVVLD